MASLDEIETRRNGNDSARIEELIDVFKWPDGKWVQVRLMDRGLLPISTHWVPIIGSKTGKESKIPRLCLNIDPASGKALKGKCPYCELGDTARAQDHYYFNAIIRELQEDQPKKAVKPTSAERETGFKDIDSRSWTPVRAIRLPGGLLDQFKAQKDLNKHKSKKTGETKKYAINHDKYGVDFNVMYDSSIKGGQKYKISKEGRTPLTEEELEYLVYDLDGAAIAKEMGLKTLEEALRDVKTLTLAGGKGGKDDDEKSKGRRVIDDDDDVDLDEDDEPKKKGKKSKHRDDDEDEDDDEDDAPFKKKGKKSKHRDDDDEDEEPKKKKGKKSKDEDEDDEDDEDEKPSKKSKKSKHRDDDEDEDDEDEDDEDDDEDEKPSKKSKKSKKSKHRDDDDDEDDEDEDDDD